MYEVYIESAGVATYIHDENSDNVLASAKIEDARNAISSFTFMIYPYNAGYDKLNAFTTMVYVYNTNRSRYDFIGRVIQITQQMDSDGAVYKTVVCESRLGYLCDSVQPYTAEAQYNGDDSRNGLQEFIDLILSNHNAQVEDAKKIYRGNVTLTTYATSEGVYKGLNYETTWEIIKSKLVDVFGGEIRLRETDGVLYLDYAEELGTTRATAIELGRNMESAQRSVDCTSVITRLIPLGAKIVAQTLDEDGDVVEETETENRLTIASANNDVIYIEDELAVQAYGIVYGTVIFDDVTDPANLKTKGTQYLAEVNMLKESNSITSLDLSLLDMDIDDIRLYDKYPCRNALIGLDAVLEVVKKTTDVIEPYSSTFDMGDIDVTLADSILGISDAYKDISGEVRKTVNNAIKNSQVSIRQIVSQETETAVQQGEKDILLSVSESTVSKDEYSSFYDTVKNILQMDADGTTMIFQTINEAIQDVGDQVQSQYSEILKYIRFEDGSIILGEKGNPLTLKIENDKIAFYQNGVAVAYFSDSKLYVTHGEFLETFKLGKFQASPRSNGNVTWKVAK